MEHAKKYVLVDPQMYRSTMPEKSLGVLDQVIHSTLKRFKAYDKSAKPQPPKPNIESELAGAMPATQQYKAKKLLRLLKDNPDIDWSDSGELIYKQSLIPKSHAADLFGDVFSSKRAVDRPIGWEAFDEGLASSRVPTDFVKRRVVKGRKRKQQWLTPT